MTDCRIVPIAEEHVESFHAALDSVARERKYLALLSAPPLEKTRAYILNGIAAGTPRMVALAAGEVAGWCDITPVSDRPVHMHAGILAIGVVRDHRGRGIGRRLMESTIAAAREKGLTRIELAVREENLNAVVLYQKMGFVVEGLKRNANRVDGVYENAYVMGLLL